VQKPRDKVVWFAETYVISRDTSVEMYSKQSRNGAGITPLKTQGN